MDGTIVDTEPFWIEAETRMIESFGGTWTSEQAVQMVGLGLEDAAEILREAGVDLPVDAIVQKLTDEVIASLNGRGAPFRPGAVELLRSLREAGVRMGLVTMSLRRMADAVVEQIGFDAFDVIVSGDSARRPKPFPDPYLQAAEALGVDIGRTVVIEDSPAGLSAGLSSGAFALGVPHIVPLAGLGADELWPTLEGRTAGDVMSLFETGATVRERGAVREQEDVR